MSASTPFRNVRGDDSLYERRGLPDDNGTNGPRYTRTAVVLHWLVGLALVGEVVFGFLLRELARGSPMRGPVVNIHKSIGIVLGILIIARIAWRLTHRPPSVPSATPRWQARAARANHAAMYACMVVIPLAGYAASNFSKYGIKFFNVVLLPPWGSNDPHLYDLLNGLHDAAAWLLMGLVALHVAATIKTAWVDRGHPFSRFTLRRPRDASSRS